MKFFMCLFVVPVLLLTQPAFAAPGAESKPVAADTAAQSKLDKILQNQVEILKQLDELKKELAIVKARATR